MIAITTRYAGPTDTSANLHAAAVALMIELDPGYSVVAEAWGSPGSLVTIVGDLS